MSPEAMSDARKVTEASDVFSLGAIAFHLFASRPPASSPTDLARILREQKGLSISSVLDGAGPKLEELIQWSTHPDVLTRIGSVEDFLTLLDDVEDELTAPAEAVVVDPLAGQAGRPARTRLRRASESSGRGRRPPPCSSRRTTRSSSSRWR